MNRRTAYILIGLFLLQAAWSATFYVSPSGTNDGSTTNAPANLQAALDAARTNGAADILHLTIGVYDASTSGANTFDFDAGLTGSDGFPVMIQGGWDALFGHRVADPEATALDGGGNAQVLYVKADATNAVADVTLENLAVRNGWTTTAHGAGILTTQSEGGIVTLVATGCVFRSNNAVDKVGGALAAQGPVTVTDCNFVTNQASSGGTVYLWPSATPAVFRRTSFADSSLSSSASPYIGWQGSTIFSSSPDLTVADCEILGMTDGSISGAGSPLYVHTGGFVTVSNTAFRNNRIPYWGSAIQLWSAGANITGCLFVNNQAGTSSGYAAVTYFNADGGASETILIDTSTFVGNSSGSGYYGDLHFRGGNLTVRNSIFDNTTVSCIRGESGCVGTVDYCDVEDGAADVSGLTYGNNNTTVDPSFQVADPDYKLTFDSPLIDAGESGSAPTRDRDGTPRPLDGDNNGSAIVDIGCDEVLNRAADSDGDTMVDGWEWDYGLDPTDGGDTSGNPDGDPYNNGDEYIADTNPTNAASYLRITAVSNVPPLSVYFVSSSNRLYTLDRKSNLIDGVWSNVPGAGPRLGVGGADSMVDADEPSSGFFYRLEVELP